LPSGQDDEGGRHALLDVLPGGDVWPAGQSEHKDEPAVEYLPAGQVPEQEAVVNPEYEPSVPAGQGVQDDEPLLLEYVPAGQSEHEDEPAVEYLPAGQS